MIRLRTPSIAAALAAALLTTTGYCVLQRGTPDEPPLAPVTSPPLRLLPEAVLPFPLVDPE